MELSKRLQAVANLVTAGYTVADIGTDHAYIPIYLVEKQLSPRVVAMDVNAGPLERAREHIRECGLAADIQLRLSNGFERLCPKETDAAVIAGMGGGLVMKILREHWDVTCSLKECILQPQSEIEKVRAFLLEEGFLFMQEDMVLDDGKYYPMMKVKPPKKNGPAGPVNEMWTGTELQYGKLLLEGRNVVLKQFLQREQDIRMEILEGLKQQSRERIALRKQELQKELEYIREGLEYYAV